MKASLLLLISTLVSHASPLFQLHEWGTFTTVAGSDGVLLSGLEREEEKLPAFVHSHLGLENGQVPHPAEIQRIFQQHGTVGIASPLAKGLGRRPLLGVTVKMETPVIYFHSDETTPIRANVKVGFDGGTISQWYPQRSSGEKLPEPPPSADPNNKPTPISAWTFDFRKPYRGFIEWDLDILPPAETRAGSLFKPGDNLGWLRARQPVTNAVRTSGGETEGYLFYRGLGHFDPGLKTTIGVDETLRLENHSGGRIPYLLVLDRENGDLRWTEYTGGLDAGGSMDVPDAALTKNADGFPTSLYQSMRTGLTRCGLNDAEARSMVETWWHSYFEAPGLRVFWVLPREATDRILPLEVTPAPAEIVRVLVGRSEVLRPRKEAEWLAASRRTGNEANPWIYLVQNDRFGLAINERVKALGKENAAR